MSRRDISRRRFFVTTAGVTAGAALAGCLDDDEPDETGADGTGDDHDDDHDDHDDDHDHDAGEDVMSVDTFELMNRDTGEVTNEVHGDHWDPVGGGFPAIREGEYVSVGANVEDDGEEVRLGADEEYELRARIADGAEEGVVDFDSHGDHVHVQGVEEGLTDVVFQLWHDGHADDETPPLTVQVVGEDAEIDSHDDGHDHQHDHDDDHHDDDDGHDDGHGHDHEDDHDHRDDSGY